MVQQIDMNRVEELAGKVTGDVAGAMSLFMAYLGDKTGVFDKLDGQGRVSLEKAAELTGLNPKYLHQWLGSVCAAGYITYHAEDDTFEITPEQALIMGR